MATSSVPTKTNKAMLGGMREWWMRAELMPQIIMQVNGIQKTRFIEYLRDEFAQTDVAKQNAFALIDTSQYPDYVFVQSSNARAMCHAFWSDGVINKYLHQTYMVTFVTADINYIPSHPSLSGADKIFKMIGDKELIKQLGPLIPRDIVLSPSEKKCTHIISIVRAYKKYFVGILDKQTGCYGQIATDAKHYYSQFGTASVSRAYFKLREIFMREAALFRPLVEEQKNEFVALDIGSSPGGWTKYLIDRGCQQVMSVDPGALQLDAPCMQRVTYQPKLIEQCLADGDVAQFIRRHGKFDIIVCDANSIHLEAAILIHKLADYLRDDGYVVFTIKLPNRKKAQTTQHIKYCMDVLQDSFEHIKLRHLLANKAKERTLIATKKQSVSAACDQMYRFHKTHSF